MFAHEGGVVVVDVGSANAQAGFAGDDAPRVVIPSFVGVPRYQPIQTFYQHNYIGRNDEQRSLFCLHRPIDRGVITNWELMELVR